MRSLSSMISPKLHSLLEEHYPIGSVQDICTLTGGEWNNVLRLNSDRGTFVLRISHPTTAPEAIAYEHKLMHFMSFHIPEVPSPIAAYDGSTYLRHDSLLVTLFPLMPGRMLERENEVECISAAKMLAQLHKAGLKYPDFSSRLNNPPLRELDWSNNSTWRWAEVKNLLFNQTEEFLKTVSDPDKRSCTEQIFAKRTEIAQEREAFRDWVAALRASGRALVFAPIQGDYWCNNLLVKDGQVSAVVDWDECKTEWLVYELGRATWEFCQNRSQHTLDCQKAVRFLQAYQGAGGPVPSTEFDLLIPFMRCVRVIEVLFSLQQAWNFGLDEHGLHNLLSLENLRDVELGL